jgi:ABC-type sugar transport system permease subunit
VRSRDRQRRSRPLLDERRREALAFLLFVAPNLFLLSVWTLWPFFHALYLSFTDWNLLRPTWNMIGFANYASLLASGAFWQVARNSVIFSVGVVAANLTISMGLALLLNQWLVARGFWRLVIFSPHITTSAAMALVWVSMYDPQYGPIAGAFEWFGLQFPNVLADTRFVLLALMVVAAWKSLGFSTIILLAALQGVDRTLKEAAAIDGANQRQIFRHVTFPAISPIMYFLIVIGLLDAIKTFDLVSVMTDGGPGNASNMFVYQIYQEAFRFQRMGYASAISVIMFILIMGFTYAQTRIKSRWVTY